MNLEVPDPRTPGAPGALIRPYSAGQQLSASFRAAPAYAGGPRFTFTQTYLFTDYNSSPGHEPGGIVNAARLYPLFRFDYPGIRGESNPPTRIRVDFRFDIGLDSNARDKAGEPLNQVGVFSDEDATPVPPSIERVFRQAYKPLPVEMYGSGLTSGKSGPAKWDNIHQWPKREDLPPTPGAAYAAHSHWRWGAVAAGAFGAPHFAGIGGAGGPLIDPGLPDQSLDFALTGRGTVPAVGAWQLNGPVPSTPTWQKLFDDGRSEPADIGGGTSLTQWWTFTAARDPAAARSQPAWSGAFFVHGFFFAHGPEVVSKGLRWALNLTRPIEKPPLTRRSRRQWLKP